MKLVASGTCARYGVLYNTGSLMRQFGRVMKWVLRLSLPGGSFNPQAANV